MSTPVPAPVSATFIRRCMREITANCSLLKRLSSTTCPICMDDFMCQDILQVLPTCRHMFHRRCILSWFSRNNTCPLCRRLYPSQQPPPPQLYSIVLRIHTHHLQHQHPRDSVFRLNFHIQPLSQESSSQRLLPSNPLERILISEGYPQLATRACGPFWVSVDSSHNVPLPTAGASPNPETQNGPQG